MFRNKMTMIMRHIGIALVAMPIMGILVACGSVFDDLDPCPQGVVLRFRYDYNLEWANAFNTQVECLKVHIYDEAGNYVTTRNETGAVLANESYQMTLDLPPGRYHAVAYGGVECEESSFSHPVHPSSGSVLHDLSLLMDPAHNARHLHDQFWGESDFSVVADALDYACDTVPMQKNTNHFRIVLANTNYEPLDGKDFEFSIVADNTHFNHDNSLRKAGVTTYGTWTTGQYDAGQVGVMSMEPGTRIDAMSRADGDDDGGNTYRVAYGELSTSRMMVKAQDADTPSPELVVRHIASDHEVLRIPIVNFMLMSKSDEEAYRIRYYNGSKMSNQEYLDRQSRWNMMFFLDKNNNWVSTRIVVNDWVVRINNVEG